MPPATISHSTSASCLSLSVISGLAGRRRSGLRRQTAVAMLPQAAQGGALNTPGRQAIDSASSSGYSNTSLKILGAISAADRPPSAPPNDIHR